MQMENTSLYNRQLIKKYPFLLPNDIPLDHYDYSYTLADELLDGWKTAFGNMMWEEIRQQLVKDNCLNTFGIDQIKEKFGELRIYTHGCSDKVNKIIDKYSVLSGNICAVCGKPDVRKTKGYILPICFDCWVQDRKYNNTFEAGRAYKESTYPYDRMTDSLEWNSYSKDGVEHHKIDITNTANMIRKQWMERRDDKC